MIKNFTKGIIKENPVLILLLGLCPTLAVTTGLKNAVGMGLSATFVLVCSNAIISMFRGAFPKKIRIPCFIVVIATFVTIVQMLLAAYLPELNEALGIFIPLIVVNCIILGRAEAFAFRNGVISSVVDGLGMGVGFTFALSIIGIIREVLGAWTIWDIPITATGFDPAAVMIMAPGAFMVVALILGWMNRHANYKASLETNEMMANRLEWHNLDWQKVRERRENYNDKEAAKKAALKEGGE